MNVGELAESAVQNLGPLDVYEKYLLHSGHKAKGNWQVRYEGLRLRAKTGHKVPGLGIFFAPFLIEPQGPIRNDRYTRTYVRM